MNIQICVQGIDRFFREVWSPDSMHSKFGGRVLLICTAITYLALLSAPLWIASTYD